MARTSVQTDNFNRTGPGVGANWAMLASGAGGNVTIDSNIRVTGDYSSNPAVARWVGAGTFTSNQYSGVRLVNGGDGLGGSYWGGAIVRASADTDAARDYYCAYKQHSAVSNNVVLAKYLNGTATVLYSGTQSAAAGDMLWLEAEGDGSSTALRVYLNDTHLTAWDYTDTTSVITGGAPGLLVCSAVFLDDWEGGNISSGVLDEDFFPASAVGAVKTLPIVSVW